jgi:hypothetical protein
MTEHEHRHHQLAQDCWRLIKALADGHNDDEELDSAAMMLIEMACDSAAESERIARGQPPRGVESV